MFTAGKVGEDLAPGAMQDGDAKTTATKEMQMAEEMIASKDMKGCAAHMHNAMDAMEK